MRASWAMLLVIAVGILGWAKDPIKEFDLKIVRDQNLPTTLQLGDCISGKLYVADPDHPLTGAGDIPVGTTLELPWRGNQNEISAIPAGSYPATVRDDGDKGWRLELKDVPGRTLVDVHIGNWPKDSIGCILLGKRLSKKEKCFVQESAKAMDDLEKLYGSPDHSRPIRLLIVDH